MGDKMKGKSVPWDSIQTYITTINDHSECFAQFKKLKAKGHLDGPFVEAKLTEPMYHMYELLCGLLDETNLVSAQTDLSTRKSEAMISTISNL
jgi:hypothetical protein